MFSTECFTDTFKGLSDSFAETMKAGLKFHEETARFWFDVNSKNLDLFRGRFEQAADEMIPFSKRNLDRFHNLFDEQSKKALELLRRWQEMGQPTNVNDGYERLFTLWRNSFETLRDSVDTVAKTNSEIFRNMTDTLNTNGAKPAAATNATPRKPANV